MCLYSWDYTINHNENEDENNRSHIYDDINRPIARHGPKFSKYENCFFMTMFVCIKQHQATFET